MDAVREAMSQPGVRRRFVLAWCEFAGWTGGYRRANARVSQWLSGEGLYRFPLVAALILIRVAGDSRMLDVLFAVEKRVEREARANEDRYGARPGMRTVHPRGHERSRESA